MNTIIKAFSLTVGAVVLLFSASSVSAVQFKTGDSINLAKEEKIDESIFISGDQLTIDSDIAGDLICAGRSIIVNSSIKGDIICAGQDIKITGHVDGNVRVAGQTITISGSVDRNLNVLAQTLVIDKISSIKGDVFFGVQAIDLSGTAGRDLAGVGETITISGSLLRNALVNSGNLNIQDTAQIDGSLDYFTQEGRAASISSGAVIGQVRRHDYVVSDRPEKVMPSKPSPGSLLSKLFFGALSFFIVGSVLIYFDKSRTQTIINRIQERPLVNALIGLAVLVTYPLIFLLLLVTIIGMPLAFLSLILYFAGLITASVYSSIVIGWNLLHKLMKQKTPNPFLSVLIGTFLLGLVGSIPVIGWLAVMIAFLAGLGAQFSILLPEKAK